MQIIKLDATDSTNDYLKRLSVQKSLEDFTTIVTEHQLKGKGQMGTLWQTEKGKNLTFSTFKKFDSLKLSKQFAVSMCVSLAIFDSLQQFQVPDLAIKWPNDIMSGRKKICGILIENSIGGDAIKSSIIGIGLNVNQTSFNDLEKASSLKLVCDKNFDLDYLLTTILNELQQKISWYSEMGYDQLKLSYEKYLFRKNRTTTFKSARNDLFNGIIRGISAMGHLQVEMENGKIKEYQLKQISILS